MGLVGYVRKHKYSHLAFIITQTMKICLFLLLFIGIFLDFIALVFYNSCVRSSSLLLRHSEVTKCVFNLYERRDACLTTFNSSTIATFGFRSQIAHPPPSKSDAEIRFDY